EDPSSSRQPPLRHSSAWNSREGADASLDILTGIPSQHPARTALIEHHDRQLVPVPLGAAATTVIGCSAGTPPPFARRRGASPYPARRGADRLRTHDACCPMAPIEPEPA